MMRRIRFGLKGVLLLIIFLSLVGCSNKESLTKELVDLVSSRGGVSPQKAEKLLRKGADPNVMVDGMPLLMHAIVSRSNPMVDVFIKYKADIYKESERDFSNMLSPFAISKGENSLIAAIKYGNYYAFNKLIESGADINQVNSSGQSAFLFGSLYWAGKPNIEGSGKIVRYFTDKPYPEDAKTSLFVAVRRKDLPNVKKYLAVVDDVDFDFGFGSALEVATDLKFTEAIPLFLERDGKISNKALFASVMTPAIFGEFAKKLGGIDPTTNDESRTTIGGLAIRVGTYDVVKEYFSDDFYLSDDMCYDLVKLYVDRPMKTRSKGMVGSRIYQAKTDPSPGKFEKFINLYNSGQCDKDKLAGEAFYYAVKNLDVEYVDKLLNLGIDPDTPSRQRGTPLNQVVRAGCQEYSENNLHIDIIKSLTRAGADPNQTGRNGFPIVNTCMGVESNIPKALGIE